MIQNIIKTVNIFYRGTFQCSKCKKHVEQPIARVNMDVFVKCLQPQNVGKVKVRHIVNNNFMFSIINPKETMSTYNPLSLH